MTIALAVAVECRIVLARPGDGRVARRRICDGKRDTEQVLEQGEQQPQRVLVLPGLPQEKRVLQLQDSMGTQAVNR